MNSKLMFMAIALMLIASPVFAQEHAPTAAGPLNLNALSMGIASGLCALAQGRAVGNAAEAMARNPGAQGAIRFALLLGLVLIESLALYTLVIIFVKG